MPAAPPLLAHKSDVRHRGRPNHLDVPVADRSTVQTVKQTLAAPRKMGTIATCSSSMRRARRYCWIVATPPSKRTSAPLAASNARDNAASIPSVTKLNVVPPCITKDGREWRVSTNTGWWYGGSSPHQPFHSSSGPRPADRGGHVAPPARGGDGGGGAGP